MEWLKCAVVGAGESGKTSLVHTYMSGRFQSHVADHVVTRYDVELRCDMRVIFRDEPETLKRLSIEQRNKSSFCFKIYDYEMEESHASQCLRDDELDEVDVVIICYQSVSKAAKQHAKSEYRQKVEARWPKAPILMAACFSDLLKTRKLGCCEDDELISANFQPQNQTEHIYCSALEYFNVDKVFNESFKIAIKNKIKNELKMERNRSIRVVNSVPQNEDLGNVQKRSRAKVKVESEFEIPIPLVKPILANVKAAAVVKQAVALFGFACFLFYLLTCKYYSGFSEVIDVGRDVLQETIHSVNKSVFFP